MKNATGVAFLFARMNKPLMIRIIPEAKAQACLPGILLAHFTAGGLPTIKSFAKNCKTPRAMIPVAKMICPGLIRFLISFFV